MVFAGTGVWKSKRGTPLLGRRCVFINDEHCGYNVRDEQISADEVSYAYDDIGNRTTAEGKTYTANNLNQYTAIDGFAPQYDDDGIHAPTSMSEVGNQTLIKTETGIWSVVYNAENRPIRWESGDTVIMMAFDRMGRRVEMRTVKDGEETLQRFAYDNYLCIQQLRGADNALFHSYIWDPTEPIATQPLVFLPASGEIAYYFHDGNKNVSDLADTQENVVHYAYTPFGTSIASAPSENPYRFSSEFHDDCMKLIYYNHRHYNPLFSRWLGYDIVLDAKNLYLYIDNRPTNAYDVRGLVRYDFYEEHNVPLAEIQKRYGDEFYGVLDRTLDLEGSDNLGKFGKDIFSISCDGKNDRWCGHIVSGREFEFVPLLKSYRPTTLVNEDGKQLITERGLQDIIAHEERRLDVYRTAIPYYLNICSGKGFWVTRCGEVCAKSRLEVKTLLSTYLDELRQVAQDAFAMYVNAEQDAISAENRSTNRRITSDGLFDGYKTIHYLSPRPPLKLPRCPSSL